MDAETLRLAVAQAGFGALWIGLVAGFVFSFNPVALAAIPVSLAYVTKTRTPRQAALFGALFVLGMILTHIALGLVASLGGGWVQHLLGRAWGLILGPLCDSLGPDLAGVDALATADTELPRQADCWCVGRFCAGRAILGGDLPVLHTGAGRFARGGGRRRLSLVRNGPAAGVCLGTGASNHVGSICRRLAGKPLGIEPVP